MIQRDFLLEEYRAPTESKQITVARQVNEQERQLRRVHGKLGAAIASVYSFRLARGERTATMAELVADVRAIVPTAKESSVDRIFRLMRQDGHLNYRVVNRARSQYELLEVNRDVR